MTEEVAEVTKEAQEAEESKVTGELPKPNYAKRRKGWHTMHYIGYDDDKNQFICKNSWGKDWADDGYIYIPYSYFPNHAQMFYAIFFK